MLLPFLYLYSEMYLKEQCIWTCLTPNIFVMPLGKVYGTWFLYPQYLAFGHFLDSVLKYWNFCCNFQVLDKNNEYVSVHFMLTFKCIILSTCNFVLQQIRMTYSYFLLFFIKDSQIIILLLKTPLFAFTDKIFSGWFFYYTQEVYF